MEILLLLIISIFINSISNIVCFVVGAKIWQKVSEGEPIELPNINPMEAIRAHNSRKEQEREQERVETILQNIEAYDGTSNGQKEVPKG